MADASNVARRRQRVLWLTTLGGSRAAKPLPAQDASSSAVLDCESSQLPIPEGKNDTTAADRNKILPSSRGSQPLNERSKRRPL